MKLFGFLNKSKKEKFQIVEPNRKWVEYNFKWLIAVYGYPAPESEQFLLTETYFPKTFGTDKVLIENMIQDLCALFQIVESKITFEIVEDLRDTYGIAYAIEGRPFEVGYEKLGENYKIHMANSLQKHPKRLIHKLVCEFIRIKLADENTDLGMGEDLEQFTYLAGIYFGFGVILSQNLHDTGRANDGFWETKWNYVSKIPIEIMAFALATYSKLVEQDSPTWRDDLQSEVKGQFNKAMDFLNEHPFKRLEKGELEANRLFNQASKKYQNNQFEEAVVALQEVLSLTKDDTLKTSTFNNIGYYLLRMGAYEESILFFKNALQMKPNFGYSNDNLGYAFIQLGKLEEGKKWLEKALQTQNNDIAYNYRNFAVYYQAKGEMEFSEEHFLKAFNTVSNSVDLLEYHYADFLLQQGKTDEGLKYLKIAKEKGEPEAIRRMNQMKKN